MRIALKLSAWPERPRRLGPGGLSIAELMVSMSILLVLSGISVALVSQAKTSSEGGMARIEARSQHRAAQQRIGLLLRSAIPPTEVDLALTYPEVETTESEIRFHAPADLLDSDAPFEPRTPDYPEFTIGMDPSTKIITVRRTDGQGPTQQIGRNFQELQLTRLDEKTVEVVLLSTVDVKGASGGKKTFEERSQSLVSVPSLR